MKGKSYPVTFNIKYKKNHDKMTTFFRLLWSLPIIVIMGVLTAGGDSETYSREASKSISVSSGGIVMGLFIATALMILFRQKYPKWWFSFNLELNRFSSRIGAYILLLTDAYPLTDDEQDVQLDVVYPNVKKDLNKWLPFVKWLLALPHYVVLVFLIIGVFFGTAFAWFSILFTGNYPKPIFDFVVGVLRWGNRVNAYAFILTTDKYPPFQLD